VGVLIFHAGMLANPGTPHRLALCRWLIWQWIGEAMRRRLKKFLPIVLIALAVQVFAPIAACWAASIAASDPLSAATICHGNGEAGKSQNDQSGAQGALGGCCSLCGALHAGAPVDPPQTAVIFAFDRRATSIVWHELAFDSVTSRAGSPEQARAPPSLS
jgi:hypothetical protein